MASGDGDDYSRDPLKAQDNANHRRMWAERQRRRWLLGLVKIWLTAIGVVVPIVLGVYTFLEQHWWRGK